MCPGYQKPKVWLFEPLQYSDFNREPELSGPSLNPSTSPFPDSQGSRAFQYYFEVSEPPMARFFASAMIPLFQDRSRAGDVEKISSMFWTVSFPRLVCAEPVIAKCLIVLVTSHEKVQSSKGPFALEPECLERFIEAITLLRTEWNSMSVDAILIASIVLAIAELSFGPSPSGLSHLYAGSKIIRQRRAHPEDYAHHGSSPEIEGLRESIELLYEAFFARMGRERGTIVSEKEGFLESTRAPQFSLPLKFTSTQQALGCLESITTTALATLRAEPADPAYNDRIHLRQSAENWLRAFQDLEAELNFTTDPEFLKACLIIRINGLAALIMSSLPTSEFQYDQHEAEFTQIADFAEEFLKIGGGMTQSVKAHLVYGTGPVNAIFFAATKCRSPSIRRRLLRALRRFNVVEGLWTSCAAYQIANQLAMVETSLEDSVPRTVTFGWTERVKLVSVAFDGPTQVVLTCSQEEYSGGKTVSTQTASIQPCRHQGFLNKVNSALPRIVVRF